MNTLLRTAIVVLAPVLAAAQSAVLQRDASISGRILGASGGPLSAGLVTVGTVGFRDGRRIFMAAGNAQPDGLGNYSIQNLAQGNYYIRLGAVSRGEAAFYPDAASIDRATSIPVEAGHQVVGIDLAMPNVPTFKVSGTVLNIPPAAATARGAQASNTVPNISFTPAGPGDIDPMASPLLANPRRGANGEFEITLPPGVWDIFPVINIRVPALQAGTAPAPSLVASPGYATGRARVRVTDRDVENVTIAIGSADVKGRVIFESTTALNLAVPSRVALQPLDHTPSPLMSHMGPQQLDASGIFSFVSAPPGRYAFQLVPLPAGFYVADLRVGTRSILADGVLSVGTDPIDPIEITLRRNGGRVEAIAAEAPGNAGAGPLMSAVAGPRMVLVPAQGRNPLLYRVTFQWRGPFVFSDVTPGDYKVFAFSNLPPGGAEQNPEFMSKYENLGVPVHVEAGQNIRVDDVKWIP